MVMSSTVEMNGIGFMIKSIYLLFAQQPYFEMSPSITPALGCVTLCIAVALNKQQRGTWVQKFGRAVFSQSHRSFCPVYWTLAAPARFPAQIHHFQWILEFETSPMCCRIPATSLPSLQPLQGMGQGCGKVELSPHYSGTFAGGAFSVDWIASWMVMGTRNLGNFFESWKIQEQVVLLNGGHCFCQSFFLEGA